MGLFFKKKDQEGGTGAGRSFAKTYDKEKTKPAIRCSICTGEQVACMRNRRTGKLQELMLLRTPADLERFCRQYGLEPEKLKRVY